MPQARLEAFNDSCNDIQASAVFTFDGLLITSTLSKRNNPDEAGAIAAAMHALAQRSSALLERGRLKQIQVEGDGGYMIVSRLADNAILTTLTRKQANMGLVLHEIKRFKEAWRAAQEDA